MLFKSPIWQMDRLLYITKMNTKDYLDRLKKIDELIRHETTGNPSELACKLEISERMLYKYIKELKMIGLPIGYCKELRSYIYTSKGKFVFGFINSEESSMS